MFAGRRKNVLEEFFHDHQNHYEEQHYTDHRDLEKISEKFFFFIKAITNPFLRSPADNIR